MMTDTDDTQGPWVQDAGRMLRRRAELEALEAALTPSEDTKKAYMSEFSVPLPDWDENGDEVMRRINVPWTTIKEIMAAIRAYADREKTDD
jgi:hypothetical protein